MVERRPRCRNRLLDKLYTWINIYLILAGASIRSQMQYRLAFVMRIIGLFISYTSTIATLWVMLSRFETMAGWTLPEVVFLLGMAVLAWGISTLFFEEFRSLDEYIVEGTFDRFLVRPINPFLHYLSIKANVAAFGQLLFSIAAFVWVSIYLGIKWTLLKVVFFLISLLSGVLIMGGALVIIASLAFWTTRSERLYWVVLYPARQLTYYPVSIYPRIVQFVLTFVIPFGFLNYYPAHVLLERFEAASQIPIYYLGPVVAVIFFAFSYGLWTLGLARYQSTGS